MYASDEHDALASDVAFQDKSQGDRLCGDEDCGVGKTGFKGYGAAVSGCWTRGFAEQAAPEARGGVGEGLSSGGEGVLFADVDLGVLGWWTGWFDGTEYKGDDGAEIAGEEGGTVDCHFDKVSVHTTSALCKAEGMGRWDGGEGTVCRRLRCRRGMGGGFVLRGLGDGRRLSESCVLYGNFAWRGRRAEVGKSCLQGDVD